MATRRLAVDSQASRGQPRTSSGVTAVPGADKRRLEASGFFVLRTPLLLSTRTPHEGNHKQSSEVTAYQAPTADLRTSLLALASCGRMFSTWICIGLNW